MDGKGEAEAVALGVGVVMCMIWRANFLYKSGIVNIHKGYEYESITEESPEGSENLRKIITQRLRNT